MGLALVIPSHKRAGRVITHKHVEGCLVCVPESQADEYRRLQPELKVVTHPDSVVGIAPKRDWIYREYGNVFMLDDDSTGMYRIYREKSKGALSQTVNVPAARCRELIEDTAETARKFGAYLFGFNTHAHPLTYKRGNPFRFGGYTPGGAFGLLAGSKLFWPNNTILGVDHFICALNAHFHRYSFYDCRFAFGFIGTYNGQGGNLEFRRDGGEKRATEYLRRMFGRAIVVKKPHKRVTRTERNEAPRTLVLPWRY